MMVSVCMITYGHEKFIRQAVEGVLMQDCDFDVEFIISNDCSPDDTDVILKDILQHHSRASRIKYTRHDKNIGMTANFLFALQKCQGTYIAFCEGDDYWTDKLKLQKQRDYLLLNTGIGLIHTGYNIYKQDSGQFTLPSSKKMPGIHDVYDELIKNNFIAMLTVMAERKIVLQASEKIATVVNNWAMVDYPLWLYISSQYKVAYLPECTATYRYLSLSASHTNSLKLHLKFLKSAFLIQLYFHKNFRKTSAKNVLTIYCKFYYDRYINIYQKLKQKIYG